jgi:hypothetical protein
MVLLMEASPASGPATFLHRKAEQAGFIVVSCSFSGNYTGTPGTVWNHSDPRVSGYEDFDYITEVINRVKASQRCLSLPAFPVRAAKAEKIQALLGKSGDGGSPRRGL